MIDILKLQKRIIDQLVEEKTNLSEENERLHGLCSLQAEGMKQMSQQIASYRELIFKEGKMNER